jgi:hypothetical protein
LAEPVERLHFAGAVAGVLGDLQGSPEAVKMLAMAEI